MSEEEQLTEHGRLLKDYLESKRRLDALQSEIDRTATQLRDVAAAFRAGKDLERDFDLDRLFDRKRLAALQADLVEVRTRKINLQGRLRFLGLEQVE